MILCGFGWLNLNIYAWTFFKSYNFEFILKLQFCTWIKIIFITLEIASLMNLVNVYSYRIEIYVLDFTWIIFQRISWDNIPRDIHVKSISCLEHMKKSNTYRAKIFMWNAREIRKMFR